MNNDWEWLAYLQLSNLENADESELQDLKERFEELQRELQWLYIDNEEDE